MTAWTTPHIHALAVVFGMILIPVLSEQSRAQQIDLNAAAEAKAQAGSEALSLHPTTDPPGPKTAGTFITFDVPGAGTGDIEGTYPSGINPAGTITGFYVDANFVIRGFLRARDGTFTTFGIPGENLSVAFAMGPSISPAGEVTGTHYSFSDPNAVVHGFLRSRQGALSTIDAPDACTTNCNLSGGTYPSSINSEGAITGFYYDANLFVHGFLRARDGTFTEFDALGACTTCSSAGTLPVMINPQGTIVGIYSDAAGLNHGFLRASDGTFTTFDPPGYLPIPFFSNYGSNLSMNPVGAITGAYFQPISGNPFGGNFRGFVRATDGSFTTFDAANYPPCCIWTFPNAITPAGAITGIFNDGFNIYHGFLRASNGSDDVRRPGCRQGGLPRHFAREHHPRWRDHGKLYGRKQCGSRVPFLATLLLLKSADCAHPASTLHVSCSYGDRFQ